MIGGFSKDCEVLHFILALGKRGEHKSVMPKKVTDDDTKSLKTKYLLKWKCTVKLWIKVRNETSES